eukprot:242178_1
MGNASAKNKKSKKEKIIEEWKRKKRNEIILLVGDQNAGKTTIINSLLKNIHTTIKQQSVQYQFKLQSFTINETCYTIDSSKNYKYLHEAYENIKTRNERHIIFEYKNNKNISFDILIDGYIHRYYKHYYPIDIIQLVIDYYKTMITSTSIRNDANIRTEIWELVPCDSYDLSKWKCLYKYAHAIIFVVDSICYDQFINVNKNGYIHQMNQLTYSLNLFHKIISTNPQNYAIKVFLIFTKLDLFVEKIKKVPLNICSEFAFDTTRKSKGYKKLALKLMDQRFIGSNKFIIPYHIKATHVEFVQRVFDDILYYIISKKTKKSVDILNYALN